MKVIIDRFEGEFAIVEMEDKTMVNLHKSLIPDAKEGDILIIEVAKQETEDRKKEISRLMDDLWE